jgi:hypothetical protein
VGGIGAEKPAQEPGLHHGRSPRDDSTRSRERIVGALVSFGSPRGQRRRVPAIPRRRKARGAHDAAALPGHAVDARHRCIAIATDAVDGRPPRVAESALVATLVNPRDGLFDRLLNRPISQAITPRLLRLPVTPNQVTLLSLAVGGRAT